MVAISAVTKQGSNMKPHWANTETNTPKLLDNLKALARIEDHLAEGEKVLVLISSPGAGYLVATENRCLILKVSAWQSFLAGSFGGGRVASFYYSDINGLEYNSGLVAGVLEVRTASYESSGNKDFWRGAGSSRNADSNDPFTLSNTLPLTRPEYRDAQPLIQKIQKLIAQAKANGAEGDTAKPDISASLATLAALRASGDLSEEEFSQAKERLLGRTS